MDDGWASDDENLAAVAWATRIRCATRSSRRDFGLSELTSDE